MGGEGSKVQVEEDGEGYPPYHLDGYKDKIEEAAVAKEKLEDPEFPPEVENIGGIFLNDASVVWKRISDIYPQGEIYSKAIDYNSFLP